MEKYVYRVNLTNINVKKERISDEYKGLGGRALSSKIIYDEVEPTVHPLSQKNKLVIATGLISGTLLSSSNRLSVGAKSPLTGGIKESNSGGDAAYKLARMGIRAIIFEGAINKNDQMVLARVSVDGLKIEEASFITGLNTYEATEKIHEKYGKKVGVIIIGRAGEFMMPTSLIAVTDKDGLPGRSCGRGGLGAVMGSKGLKAVIIDDSGVSDDHIRNNQLLKTLLKEYAVEMQKNQITGEFLPKYGTSRLVMLTNAMKGLPTRNYSQGTFEHAENISGERLAELISKRSGEKRVRHSCMAGCVIGCSMELYDEENNLRCQSFEYESIVLLGSNLGLSDLDQIATLNYLCDDIGVDTLDTGGALGVLTTAGVFKFGDYDNYKKAIEEIRLGTPLGRLIASGSATCGKVYGVTHVPAVNGQNMPAFDPRVYKGLGVTYAVGPMGADHTAGNANVIPVDPRDKDVQIDASRQAQINAMLQDSLGICMLAGRVLLTKPDRIEDMIELLNGFKLNYDELKDECYKMVQVELEFNNRAGIGKGNYRLPDFFREEALEPGKDIFDVEQEQMNNIFIDNNFDGAK